jgi:hypothetical protein
MTYLLLDTINFTRSKICLSEVALESAADLLRENGVSNGGVHKASRRLSTGQEWDWLAPDAC